MSSPAAGSWQTFYPEDEVAWLDAMARMARDRGHAGLDLDNLAESLMDLAERERREVRRRLVDLLTHLLMWIYQPDDRTRQWRLIGLIQRQGLADLVSPRTLRDRADTLLDRTYAEAIERVAIMTGIRVKVFPERCRYTMDQLLSMDLAEIAAAGIRP